MNTAPRLQHSEGISTPGNASVKEPKDVLFLI